MNSQQRFARQYLRKTLAESNLIGPRISTMKFDFNAQSNLFTAEISELDNFQWGQLYNDACDTGFVMVSHKTGRELGFYLAGKDVNEEGEVMGWRFKSCDYGRTGINVLIIND